MAKKDIKESKKIVKKVDTKVKTEKPKAAKTVKATKSDVVESKIEVKVEKTHKGGVSIDVMGKDGKVTGKLSIPAEIFSAKINPVLMAQAVRVYLANQRGGTASTKTRGEVQGSTRKIYRQKGTGRARHGGIRAPIFVGGGIVFGPQPRDYSLKFPQKMKHKALFSALTVKFNDKKILIADSLTADKTSKMQNVLKALNIVNKKGKGDNILFVIPGKNDAVERVSRNLEGVTLEKASNLHTYEVLKSKYILFMKDSIDVLSQTFLKS